jgi:hypothetical protein
MQSLGLCDDVIEFDDPVIADAGIKEKAKRQWAKRHLLSQSCTHWIVADADELYLPSQAKPIIAEFIEKTREMEQASTACQMQTYYGSVNHKISPAETYWVQFICKGNQEEEGVSEPLFDASRKPCEPLFLLERDQLEMHHFSWVRASEESYRKKFANSSHEPNRHKAGDFAKELMAFDPEKPLLQFEEYTLIAEKNPFGIKKL